MCRLTTLLAQPPVAMLPTGITPDGETVEYAMVVPGAMILGLTDDPIVAVDMVWSTSVSCN